MLSCLQDLINQHSLSRMIYVPVYSLTFLFIFLASLLQSALLSTIRTKSIQIDDYVLIAVITSFFHWAFEVLKKMRRSQKLRQKLKMLVTKSFQRERESSKRECLFRGCLRKIEVFIESFQDDNETMFLHEIVHEHSAFFDMPDTLKSRFEFDFESKQVSITVYKHNLRTFALPLDFMWWHIDCIIKSFRRQQKNRRQMLIYATVFKNILTSDYEPVLPDGCVDLIVKQILD
jgi:hypothetical protein